MKLSKLLFSLGIFVFGISLQTFAQVIELPEIEIVATNYKYLNALGEEVSVPVRQLEDAVADYDLKSADFYEDEYQTYFVTFFIPEGKILASYDGKGNLLRTAERFKDVDVPASVRQSVAKRFPNWSISKDVYRVNFHDSKGITRRTYKLIIENGDQRMRIKVNEQGEFI